MADGIRKRRGGTKRKGFLGKAETLVEKDGTPLAHKRWTVDEIRKARVL